MENIFFWCEWRWKRWCFENGENNYSWFYEYDMITVNDDDEDD